MFPSHNIQWRLSISPPLRKRTQQQTPCQHITSGQEGETRRLSGQHGHPRDVSASVLYNYNAARLYLAPWYTMIHPDTPWYAPHLQASRAFIDSMYRPVDSQVRCVVPLPPSTPPSLWPAAEGTKSYVAIYLVLIAQVIAWLFCPDERERSPHPRGTFVGDGCTLWSSWGQGHRCHQVGAYHNIDQKLHLQQLPT